MGEERCRSVSSTLKKVREGSRRDWGNCIETTKVCPDDVGPAKATKAPAGEGKPAPTS
jgi:hypothetical protein